MRGVSTRRSRMVAVRFIGLVGMVIWLSLAPAAGAAGLRSPFFAPTSFVNQRVDGPGFQVDPNSATMVNGINKLVNGVPGVAAGHGTWVSADGYAYPIYVVDSTIPLGQPGYTPKVPVAITYLPNSPYHVSLQNLINSLGGVPIPSYAQPATGTDQILDVYDSGTDTFYEFWHFCPQNPASFDPAGGNFSNLSACQSRSAQAAKIGVQATAETAGIVQQASQSDGIFSDKAYPGYSYWTWGTLGSNITNLVGEATISELQSGVINHAVAVTLPSASGGLKDSAGNLLFSGTYCTDKWAYPAQQKGPLYTTNTASDCVPEGVRLRLNLTDTQIAALSLTPMAKQYAYAAAHYGIVVRERSASAPSFLRESPYPIFWKACPNGTCPNGVPINPYTGKPFGDKTTPTSTSIYAGSQPYQLMKNFPWTNMQVQKMVTCSIVQGACPGVSVASPTAGSTVTGTVTITGSKMANTTAQIAGVQFKVDGANIGAEDTTAPYSVSWNSALVAKGSHVLTAVTRDTTNHLNNTPPVQITVN